METNYNEDDALLYTNRRNARLEYRENIRQLLSKIVYSAKVKHSLSAREMFDILYEEFYNIAQEVKDIEDEAKMGCLDSND